MHGFVYLDLFLLMFHIETVDSNKLPEIYASNVPTSPLPAMIIHDEKV